MASSAIPVTGDKDYAMRAVLIAACVVIVAAGIKAAAHVLSIILISLLMAYIIVPLPQWLMRRFRIPKGLAITLTVISVIILYSVVTLAFVEASLEMKHKLPLYEERLRGVLEHVTGFLAAHGVHSGAASTENWYSSDKVLGFAKDMYALAETSRQSPWVGSTPGSAHTSGEVEPDRLIAPFESEQRG